MFINFSNHPHSQWSSSQIQAAEQYGKIYDLSFPQVPPDMNEAGVDEMACRLADQIKALNPTAVMCQGEFTLAFRIVSLLKAADIIVVAACTNRATQEEQLPDGSTRKVSVFDFRQFRRY